ncbi:hypothetical protein MYX65_01355 [Acidobacteria bacterium AH-259-L09]|nr:hypothetical protein [Acidobacteria bacterium AH-259-L09]
MTNEQTKTPQHLQVECYAGYKAEQRPRRFCLAGHRHQVEEVLEQWYEPEGTYFRVRADDGNIYTLRCTRRDENDVWTLESFRSPFADS